MAAAFPTDDSLVSDFAEASLNDPAPSGQHSFNHTALPRPAHPHHSTVQWQEKIHQTIQYKEAGNEKYKSGDHKGAIGKYHRALLYLKGLKQNTEPSPFTGEKIVLPKEAQQEVSLLTVQVYNNLSACILQTDTPMYDKVLMYCEHVLEENPSNVKALYRKGVALCHLKCPEDAIGCLRKAANQPDGQKDANIKKYLQLCEKSLVDQDKELKHTYQAMFAS